MFAGERQFKPNGGSTRIPQLNRSHEQGANLPQRRQCVLPLRRRQLSVPVRNDINQMEAASRRQKDFETKHSGVFAAPGLPLAQF
jgi:hypothetical protein